MFDKKKYDQQFAKEKYDRIALNVPKGDRDKIAEHAKTKGFNSLTEYIKFVVYKDMNSNENTHSVSVGDVNITQGDGNTIHIG